jgi:hypothetical protein
MGNPEDVYLQNNASDVMLCAFALADCVVHVDPQIAKYLRAVHRTALELAVPNLFGLEIGGYWLTSAQINQLRKLPDCYPSTEINFVRRAVESYLLAQTEELSTMPASHAGREWWVDVDNSQR